MNCPECNAPLQPVGKFWVCPEHGAVTPQEPGASQGQPHKPRLFLSYGRRDAAALAVKLENDLKSAGYEVWRDAAKIRHGEDFVRRIEDGLRSTQIVVALLSPHAVRRGGLNGDKDNHDSVCLDELSFARFASPPKTILPVMVAQCELPFVVCRLDYVDLCRWTESESQYRAGLDKLVASIEDVSAGGTPRYRTWGDDLRPWDFIPYLETKRRDFTGRDWLFSEIDIWRSNPDERALLIKGDPGVGKSAVVAELVHRNPGGQVLAYHCCQWDEIETLSPARFVRGLAAMIASRLPDYAVQLEDAAVRDALSEARCERDPAAAFEEGVLIPLQKLPAPEEGIRYVLVDALDEALRADPCGSGAGRKTIVDVLADRLDRLPPWMRVLATTRKEPSVLNRLKGLRAREIDAADRRNMEDIDRYIRVRLKSLALSARLERSRRGPESVVKILSAKGNGNFQYVVQALQGVERDEYDLAGLEELPPGLAGLYHRFFDRLFQPDHERKFEPVRRLLQVVVASREPLPAGILAAASGMDPEEALPRWLRRLAQYLPERRDGSGAPTYAVYHKSLADWLTDSTHDYHVSVLRGEELLADYCMAMYAGGAERVEGYALRHISAHLVSAGRWDGLVGGQITPGVLTDLRFLKAKCEAGLVHDLVRDYNEAIEKLSESGKELDSRQRICDAERVDARKSSLCAEGNEESHVEWVRTPSPAGQEPGEGARKYGESSLRAERLQHFANFVSAHIAALNYSPQDVIPLAYNSAQGGPVSEQAERLIGAFADPWLRRVLRPPCSPSHPECVRVIEGHVSGVRCLCLCPNELHAVSVGTDNSMRIWDLGSGACLLYIEKCAESEALSVGVPPDGQYVVIGCGDGSLHFLDFSTGKRLRTLSGHESDVWWLDFGPDRLLASSSSDGSVRIWDRDTGAATHIFEAHTKLRIVRFCPGGRKVIAAGEDGCVRVWSLETGALLNSLEGHTNGVWGLSVGPDGRFAVSASWDKTLCVWDLALGLCLHTLHGHERGVRSVSVGPDGRHAVSASADRSIRLWDIVSGTCLRLLPGHFAEVKRVVFFSNGKHLVSASEDRTIRLWDLMSDQSPQALAGHKAWILGVASLYDGRHAVSVGHDWKLRVWNSRTCECVREVDTYCGWVWGVSACPDGRRVLTASEDKTLRILDLDDGALLGTLLGHSGDVRSVSVCPDGRRAVSVGGDKTVRVWDLETHACLRTLMGHRGGVWCVSVSPCGAIAATGGEDEDSMIRLWDLQTGDCCGNFCGEHTDWIQGLCFSPKGDCVLSAGSDGAIKIWSLREGRCIRTLSGHRADVYCVVFSPDGRTVASAGADKTVRIWNPDTASCIAVYSVESAAITVAYAPSGDRVVCGTCAGQMHVLALTNFPAAGSVIVTPVRLWNYGSARKDAASSAAATPGRWDDQLTCRCPYCGVIFVPPIPCIEVGVEGAQVVRGRRCLPESAYADPRLLVSCSHCGAALKMNPFVVDNSI